MSASESSVSATMLSKILITLSITAMNTRVKINSKISITTTSCQTLATPIDISMSHATTPSAPTLPFQRSRRTMIYAKLSSIWYA